MRNERNSKWFVGHQQFQKANLKLIFCEVKRLNISTKYSIFMVLKTPKNFERNHLSDAVFNWKIRKFAKEG